MTDTHVRTFTAADGRVWRLSEFFATKLIRQLAIESGEDRVPVPLLLTCGDERRWVLEVPADWKDAPESTLVELLRNSVPIPAGAWYFGGLSDG